MLYESELTDIRIQDYQNHKSISILSSDESEAEFSIYLSKNQTEGVKDIDFAFLKLRPNHDQTKIYLFENKEDCRNEIQDFIEQDFISIIEELSKSENPQPPFEKMKETAPEMSITLSEIEASYAGQRDEEIDFYNEEGQPNFAITPEEASALEQTEQENRL